MAKALDDRSDEELERGLAEDEFGERKAATAEEILRRRRDAIKITQQDPGKFELPNWDPASQKKVRDALLVLNTTLADTRRMFGTKDQVDPVRHLIGTAMGWGGNPEKDAFYLPTTPAKNDGKTVHKLNVKDVPVDGFWSITVYNAEGYLEPNPYNAYSLNNITAEKSPDGSVAVQFGGCDGKIPNYGSNWRGWRPCRQCRSGRREPHQID
jgi:hypothetical protein